MENTTHIKTIDVTAKEWFDRQAGNSYFSAIIVINKGMEGEKYIGLPFQYGYDDRYTQAAMEKLVKDAHISDNDKSEGLSRYCGDRGIILRTNKITGCRKKDVIAYPEHLYDKG